MGCPKPYEDWRFVSAEPADVEKSPFRFSSEYLDSETNLVYYNYRYYSPEIGRWLSRDKIGERGGYNLYAMVGNDPVGRWDWLGLAEGEVLWVVDDYEINEYNAEVKKAAQEIAALDARIVLYFKDWKALRPPKCGEITGTLKTGYLYHLWLNRAIKDTCFDRLYATKVRENRAGKPTPIPKDIMLNREVLGKGENWDVLIYTRRVEIAQVNLGINSLLWIKSIIKHEFVHSIIGGGHIDKPRNLMMPATDPDDATVELPVLQQTKDAIIKGFGF